MQLVCTGALSNAALLLMLFPEVMPMVEVTLMGGCLGVGNTHPVAEFNIVVRAPMYWLLTSADGGWQACCSFAPSQTAVNRWMVLVVLVA